MGRVFYCAWCAAAHRCHSWASLAKAPPQAFPVCCFHTILWSLGSPLIFQIFPPARTVVFFPVSLLFPKILSSLQKPSLSAISFLWVMFSGFPSRSSAYAETIRNQIISCCFCPMSLLSGGFRTWLYCLIVAKFTTNLHALMLAGGSLVFESSDAQFWTFNLLLTTHQPRPPPIICSLLTYTIRYSLKSIKNGAPFSGVYKKGLSDLDKTQYLNITWLNQWWHFAIFFH